MINENFFINLFFNKDKTITYCIVVIILNI